jgi:phosphoadenosine phosphosulfate reductase
MVDPIPTSPPGVAEWAAQLEQAEPAEVVRWAVDTFGDELVLACSFSIEDAVVASLLAEATPRPKVFALDTGRLPEETYRAAESLASRYGLSIEWYFPRAEAVEKLVRAKGPFSFYDSLEARHECCGIRKVEPLRRALAGRRAWLTGLRRGQSVTRDRIAKVEWDSANGLVKVNPLADWDRGQVWAYAEAHGVPIHPLHRKGYPSIGCAPCTRAVQPDEHERAGRWWWENPEHKECGLHRA